MTSLRGIESNQGTNTSSSLSSLNEPLLNRNSGEGESTRAIGEVSLTDDHDHDHDHSNDNNNTSNNTSNSNNNNNSNNKTSKNIWLILLYTFIIFSSRSLWNQSVLPAYVYLLRSSDPKYVGIITAIMGMAQLLSSFPAGYIADKYRRDSMLRVGSGVGFLAACCTFFAASNSNMHTSASGQFWVLSLALSLWGVFWGICNTSISALFADSIHDGDRSLYFTHRRILQLCGSMMGPIGALAMFTKLGNAWTIEECSFVLQAGQVLCVPALILLHFIKDDYCIQHEHEHDHEHDDHNNENEVLSAVRCTRNNAEGGDGEVAVEITEGGNTADRDIDHEDCEDEECRRMITREIATACNTTDEASSSCENASNFLCIPSNRIVPVLVTAGDVLGGLAAGMSVRYFPIFFLHNLRLRPDQVQIVFAATMLVMAGLSYLAQWMGKKIGRLQTTLLMKYTGVSFLFAIIYFSQNQEFIQDGGNDDTVGGEDGHSDDESTSTSASYKSLFVCVLYVLRTSFMNAPGSLTRSVLMDHVPKQERAKWSSLESVNMFSWAGSAAIGGILVDWEGILFNFTATAFLQIFATVPLILALLFGNVQTE